MPKDNENIRLPLVGPVSPSEPHGFQPDQMIRCDVCLRANPPTRVDCLYCAAALPAVEELQRLRRPTLRPPEKHQPGYNNIFLPFHQKSLSDEVIAEAAGLLKLSIEDLGRIVAAGVPLPVARTASSQDAELVGERLTQLGLQTITLADADVGLSNMISRVRNLDVDSNGLGLSQSSGVDADRFRWSDVRLILSGRATQRTVELTERKSRRAENEIVDKSEFHADEALLDIYTMGSSMTWRISTNGFDFSCLGDQKTLVANENIVRLKKLICTKAPAAIIDDSYNLMRQTLDPVWPLEQETLSRGWRREAPGRVSFGAATIMSNEKQFSLYSRIRFHFLLNG